MTIDRVNPPELPGPSGFSHAVRVSGGTTVYLAGQTALDTDGRIVGSTIVAQFEQALGNLLAALRAAGGTAENLASLTIYLVDMGDYQAHSREIGAVWQRLAGAVYPAMAGIGVTRLWDADALVEVAGVACV
ncbi:MAG: RidA family protein [Sciscionella sp.]